MTTLDTLILFMYYIGIAASMNIIMGFTGYVSFGQAVFLGISAYVYVLLTYFYESLNQLHHMGYGLGILAVASIAGLVSALVAASVGSVVLRLRGAFFAIATIGLDFSALYIVKAIVPDLDPNYFFGAQIILPGRLIVDKYSIFNAMFITFLAVTITNFVIKRSSFGIGLTAIREDEDAAESLGVPTAKYKTIAFAISAFYTGMFGAIYSLNGGGVDSGIFSLAKSVDMIVMIVIGGLGTVLGPVIGGVIYFILYDTLLRSFPGINLVILGGIVAIVILFAPEGVIGYLRKAKIFSSKFGEVLE